MDMEKKGQEEKLVGDGRISSRHPLGHISPAFHPRTLGLIHHEFFGTLWYRLIYMYANRLLMYLKLG